MRNAAAPRVSHGDTRSARTGARAVTRRLLTLRRDQAALRDGTLTLLETPDGVLGYERSAPASRLRVLVNFTDAPARVPGGDGRVLVSSCERDPASRFARRLGPDEAVVLAEPS